MNEKFTKPEHGAAFGTMLCSMYWEAFDAMSDTLTEDERKSSKAIAMTGLVIAVSHACKRHGIKPALFVDVFMDTLKHPGFRETMDYIDQVLKLEAEGYEPK